MTNIVKEYVEVLSMDDVKSFLRVTHKEDDNLISTLIKAARKTIERFTSKAFLTQEREEFFNMKNFKLSSYYSVINSGLKIPLMVSPIQKVVSVNVITDGAMIDVTDFALTNNGSYYNLLINCDSVNHQSVIKVSYVAGFRDAEDVPEPLKVATMMLVSDLYKEKDVGFKSDVHGNIKCLIKPYCHITI